MEQELELRILPNGDVELTFFAVEFSEFIIDYVLSKNDRERYDKYGTRKIYCG